MTCSTNPTAGGPDTPATVTGTALLAPAASTVMVALPLPAASSRPPGPTVTTLGVGGLVGGGGGEVIGPVAGPGGDDELGAGEVAVERDGRGRDLEIGRRYGGGAAGEYDDGAERVQVGRLRKSGGEPGRVSVGETGRRPGWRVSKGYETKAGAVN